MLVTRELRLLAASALMAGALVAMPQAASASTNVCQAAHNHWPQNTTHYALRSSIAVTTVKEKWYGSVIIGGVSDWYITTTYCRQYQLCPIRRAQRNRWTRLRFPQT